jgi:Domain of unknown function (DU1801)
MESILKLGTFDDVVAGANPEVARICLELRNIISDLHPDCVEVPRPGEPSAAYGYGEKKMSEAYAYIMPQSNYANLGFYHGANLNNHEAMLTGTGKKLRHVKIRNIDEARDPLIQSILKDAMKERSQALGIAMEENESLA